MPGHAPMFGSNKTSGVLAKLLSRGFCKWLAAHLNVNKFNLSNVIAQQPRLARSWTALFAMAQAASTRQVPGRRSSQLALTMFLMQCGNDAGIAWSQSLELICPSEVSFTAHKRQYAAFLSWPRGASRNPFQVSGIQGAACMLPSQ